MSCFVVTGNQNSRQEYIDTFIQSHKILSYSVIRSENTKIADARSLIKQLSQKLGKAERRLMIISGEITIEAQNALLKSLEELPDNWSVIFSIGSKDQLVSTILSRCHIVNLSQVTEAESTAHISTKFASFLSKRTPFEIFKLSDQFDSSDIHQYVEFLSAVRLELLSSAASDKKNVGAYMQFIETLQEYFPLIKKNNVNKKYLLEILLLSI